MAKAKNKSQGRIKQKVIHLRPGSRRTDSPVGNTEKLTRNLQVISTWIPSFPYQHAWHLSRSFLYLHSNLLHPLEVNILAVPVLKYRIDTAFL